MRIVIVQRRFHPNTLGWVQGLSELGHDVRMIVHGTPAPSDPATDVPIIRVPPSERLTSLVQRLTRTKERHNVWIPQVGMLWRELGRSRTDLVVLKQVRLTSVVVSVVALLRGVRRIGWTNDPSKLRRRAHWRWLALLGFIPRRQIFTTMGEAGSIDEPVTDRFVRFVPYAVGPPDAPRSPEPARGPLRVLTVGKFGPLRKRSWWTLDAACRAGLLDGSVTFTFVGSGGEDSTGHRRIRDIVDGVGCDELVEVRFDVPHAQMGGVYREHNVLVVPSVNEPFGMVVLEAMAHGLAVIVSDTVGAKSCVVPDRSGLVFQSDDVDDLADKLKTLASDPTLVASMGREGRALVERHASPRSCAQAIVDLSRARASRRRHATRRSSS